MYEQAADTAAGLAVGLQPTCSELFGVVGFAGMLSSNFGAALARIYGALRFSLGRVDLEMESTDGAQRELTNVVLSFRTKGLFSSLSRLTFATLASPWFLMGAWTCCAATLKLERGGTSKQKA
jgi:hypothetical protein